MSKSRVRSPQSDADQRKSKLENRNSKFVTGKSCQVSPNFEFRFSSFRPRTSGLGPRTLIIGYGNPVRSDDGFGWHASRMLAQALAGEPAEVITCHQLTPELAEPLSRSSRAVFIDADSQGVPGEIHCRELELEPASPQSFTHTCTPGGLLAGAERLYGHHPQAVVITLSAQTFDFGDTLSPAVAAALPKVVERVRRLAVLASPAAAEGK